MGMMIFRGFLMLYTLGSLVAGVMGLILMISCIFNAINRQDFGERLANMVMAVLLCAGIFIAMVGSWLAVYYLYDTVKSCAIELVEDLKNLYKKHMFIEVTDAPLLVKDSLNADRTSSGIALKGDSAKAHSNIEDESSLSYAPDEEMSEQVRASVQERLLRREQAQYLKSKGISIPFEVADDLSVNLEQYLISKGYDAKILLERNSAKSGPGGHTDSIDAKKD